MMNTYFQLISSGYDPNKESKFLIHGFGDSGLTTTMLSIKNEILKTVNKHIVFKFETILLKILNSISIG